MVHRTPWKKSRTFGDIYGGRERHRFADNIVARAHSLPPPEPGQATPIILRDNPSRDAYFPLEASAVRTALSALPEADVAGLTHVWLRRPLYRKAPLQSGAFGLYVAGSRVCAIILFAFPRSRVLDLGERTPNSPLVAEVRRYGADVHRRGRRWHAAFTPEAARRFALQGILYHEIGHHQDRRRWSDANARRTEAVADQYARRMGSVAAEVLNELRATCRAD